MGPLQRVRGVLVANVWFNYMGLEVEALVIPEDGIPYCEAYQCVDPITGESFDYTEAMDVQIARRAIEEFRRESLRA